MPFLALGEASRYSQRPAAIVELNAAAQTAGSFSSQDDSYPHGRLATQNLFLAWHSSCSSSAVDVYQSDTVSFTDHALILDFQYISSALSPRNGLSKYEEALEISF